MSDTYVTSTIAYRGFGRGLEHGARSSRGVGHRGSCPRARSRALGSSGLNAGPPRVSDSRIAGSLVTGETLPYGDGDVTVGYTSDQVRRAMKKRGAVRASSTE